MHLFTLVNLLLFEFGRSPFHAFFGRIGICLLGVFIWVGYWRMGVFLFEGGVEERKVGG